SDGVTELDYFIEEKVDGDYAIFWVEIDAIPVDPDAATIYLYYGKADAITTSDGEATFPWLFDDFNDYSIDDTPNLTDWETEGTGVGNTITVQADPADATKKCFRIQESGDTTLTILRGLLKDYRLSFAFYFRLRPTIIRLLYFGGTEDGTIIVYVRRDEVSGRFQWQGFGGAYQEFAPQYSAPINTWFEITQKVMDVGETYMQLYSNGTDYIGGFRNTPVSGINNFRFLSTPTGANTFYVGGVGQDKRYIFARKFVTPEPAHGAWGAEESL
ncbi:unnamed protein product, partial [marine sediment metagenome]